MSRCSSCSEAASATAAGRVRAGPKGGHALAILPGLTHYDLDESPLFAAVTLAFLDDQPS